MNMREVGGARGQRRASPSRTTSSPPWRVWRTFPRRRRPDRSDREHGLAGVEVRRERIGRCRIEGEAVVGEPGIELLRRERARLDTLAHTLLERETLDQPEAYEVAGVELPDSDHAQEAKATANP